MISSMSLSSNTGEFHNIRGDNSSVNRFSSNRQASTSQEEILDLHELAKGWKAAVARATDPSTRLVVMIFVIPFN